MHNNSFLLGWQEHEQVLCLDQAFQGEFSKASVNHFVSTKLRESNFHKAYSLVIKYRKMDLLGDLHVITYRELHTLYWVFGSDRALVSD